MRVAASSPDETLARNSRTIATRSARASSTSEYDGVDMSVFTTVTPSYADVLDARADRAAMVRDFLATVTSEELATPHTNPGEPKFQVTTRSCLHTILEEEWEHHRYAVRDLDAIEAKSDA